MNKALIKTKAAEANQHWQDMTLNVMEKCWLIGKSLAVIKAEVSSEAGAWQKWCEENLHFGYSHASRFLAIGTLPKKPELPKIASDAQMPMLSIENLALVAGRVKKGISQELAIKEAFFPPPPPRTIMASDDEPVVANVMPAVPEAATKSAKEAKKYLTRPLALDIIGIVSDKEDVDVFVNRTTLEVIFDGLAVAWKGDAKKLRSLAAAKLVLM